MQYKFALDVVTNISIGFETKELPNPTAPVDIAFPCQRSEVFRNRISVNGYSG